MEQVLSLGLPSEGISSIAYDESQGYFGVGCKNGKVLLIANGWEQWLSTETCDKAISHSSIVQLLFRRGDSLLYGVNQVGQILTWSLSDFKCISMSFPDPILKIALNPASPWLVIAFKSGLVKLMDCISTRMSNYIIPIDVGNGQKLVDIHLNPLDFNLILLGYESECVVWNFEEKRAQERYSLFDKTSSKESIQSSSFTLTNVSWNPNGFEFATSYSNGSVAVWSIKKNLLQGLGLKKKKHIHIYQTGSSIEGIEWVEATSTSSLLFVSHSSLPKVTRLEIIKDKYDKATGVILNCKDVVESMAVFIAHHTCILLTISLHGHFEFHYPKGSHQTEIPASLQNFMRGPHIISTVCDDGFLLINSIKQSKQKKAAMVHGGSVYPKNTTRNYHVLVMFREGNLEFWHLSIPFPVFLCKVALNHVHDLGAAPDFSDLSIEVDLKDRVLILQSTSKIVICDFVQQNADIDDMMDQLDSTLAALETDRAAIRTLTINKSHPVVVEQEQAVDEENEQEEESKEMGDQEEVAEQEEEQVVDLSNGLKEELRDVPLDMNDATVWATSSPYLSRTTTPNPSASQQNIAPKERARSPSVPPELMTRSSSLKDLTTLEIKCSKTPPMFIADAQWTTSVSIDAQCVIASYDFSSHSRSVVLATRSSISLISLGEGRVLAQTPVQEYFERQPDYVKSVPCITHVCFCMMNEERSFLVLTTQSILLFKLVSEKMGPVSSIPLFVSHCEEEFGMVLKVEGLNRNYKVCTLEYESWGFFVVITSSSILVYQTDSTSDNEGSIEMVHRRDFDTPISNGGLVQILDSSYIVLVMEEEIVMLGVASLNIMYKKSLLGLDISKSHLSESYIGGTGFVGLWHQNNQWKLYRLNVNTQIPSFDVKVFDATKAKRYAEEHGLSIGTGKRNQAADQLFAPVTIPASNTRERVHADATGLAGDLARVGNQLAERGEKLDELSDRSGELANASSSFANSMKQLRQAQEKRWV